MIGLEKLRLLNTRFHSSGGKVDTGTNARMLCRLLLIKNVVWDRRSMYVVKRVLGVEKTKYYNRMNICS